MYLGINEMTRIFIVETVKVDTVVGSVAHPVTLYDVF